MHVQRQPSRNHKHINWAEEAFLLDSSNYRTCCAADRCQRLGSGDTEILQSTDSVVTGCRDTGVQPSLQPLIAARGSGSKQKTGFQLFVGGQKASSHFTPALNSHLYPPLLVLLALPTRGQATRIFLLFLSFFKSFPWYGSACFGRTLRRAPIPNFRVACFNGKESRELRSGTVPAGRRTTGAHGALAEARSRHVGCRAF